MAEQVMSPKVGQAAACPYGRPPSRRSSSPRSPPIGGREAFGLPTVMIKEVTKKSQLNEQLLSNKLRPRHVQKRDVQHTFWQLKGALP